VQQVLVFRALHIFWNWISGLAKALCLSGGFNHTTRPELALLVWCVLTCLAFILSHHYRIKADARKRNDHLTCDQESQKIMGKARPNFICIIERVYKATETGKRASALITVSSQNAHSNRANESPGSTNGWMSASKRIATMLGDPRGQRAVA
jgi:hypothetical protein